MKWLFSLFQTGFLLPLQPANINFEIDFCRLKIQFVKLDYSKFMYRSTGGKSQSNISPERIDYLPRNLNLRQFNAISYCPLLRSIFRARKSKCNFLKANLLYIFDARRPWPWFLGVLSTTLGLNAFRKEDCYFHQTFT